MAKVRPKENFNLFKQPKPVEAPRVEEPARVVAIKDPCPRCGGRSLKTVRAFEHNGNTHYCAGGCLSEDRMDCFYFTPRVETFDEAAEREIAKKTITDEIVTTEIVSEAMPETKLAAFEVETEALPEGEQVALIETGEKWEEEWRGMPEFVQNNLMPWKSVSVHFENRQDMEKFAKLVKQTIGLNTQFIWYPQAEINRAQTKKLVDAK